MKQTLAQLALVVKEYDEAIDFYTNKLHFQLIEECEQVQIKKPLFERFEKQLIRLSGIFL